MYYYLLLLLTLVCTACFSDTSSGTETQCEYNEVLYAEGDTFPSIDSCNSCVCTSGGVVACTEKACVEQSSATTIVVSSMVHTSSVEAPLSSSISIPIRSSASVSISSVVQDIQSCIYNEITYLPGELFDAIDGCNSCSCSNGVVDCASEPCL